MLPVIILMTVQLYLGFSLNFGFGAMLSFGLVGGLGERENAGLLVGFTLLTIVCLLWHCSGVIRRFGNAGVSPWWCLAYLASPILAIGLIGTLDMTIFEDTGNDQE